MKKNVMKAALAAALAATVLVACDRLPIGQVMDGDGMINENPSPDPTKPSTDSGDTTDNGDNGNNTDNTDNTTTVVVDDETVYASFINNECSAKFDHIISEENTSYTFDEMIEAKVEEYKEIFIYDDSPDDYDYNAENSYALIDCGMDGVKELAVKTYCSVSKDEQNSFIFEAYFILKNFEDGLKCVAMEDGFYRSWAEINEYGVIKSCGSGGANLYVEEVSFVNEKGERIFDYESKIYRGYAEPTLPAYEISEEKRTDILYNEQFSQDENFYETHIVNLNDYPEYPSNLEYDAEGKYTAESQAKYDKYMADYNKYLDENIFCFEDQDGKTAEPSADLKKFLDSNDIKYFDGTMVDEMVFEHEAELGLHAGAKEGGMPGWISLNGQGTSYAFEGTDYEAGYIGEFVDDLKDPNLQIAKGSDGKYIVQIGIGRLCFMPDGVGELYEDRMDFVINDENGNPMEGYIKINGKDAEVTFTYSDWEYIKAGDVFNYVKNSDEPNIFVPMQ